MVNEERQTILRQLLLKGIPRGGTEAPLSTSLGTPLSKEAESRSYMCHYTQFYVNTVWKCELVTMNYLIVTNKLLSNTVLTVASPNRQDIPLLGPLTIPVPSPASGMMISILKTLTPPSSHADCCFDLPKLILWHMQTTFCCINFNVQECECHHGLNCFVTINRETQHLTCLQWNSHSL